MIRSNSSEPLKLVREPQPHPPMYGVGSPLIADTWRRFERKFADQGASAGNIVLAREVFAAAVYAASAAITAERADAQALSEAAERIERRR